ncbi:MAG: hypothetical protein BWK75_04385 [Candidatus Altiarchaeales archaeon A3]|nr:MAG: hypothetical protein BWK75_04385 [Candidatus Altiarchaeales archaeon A3]
MFLPLTLSRFLFLLLFLVFLLFLFFPLLEFLLLEFHLVVLLLLLLLSQLLLFLLFLVFLFSFRFSFFLLQSLSQFYSCIPPHPLIFLLAIQFFFQHSPQSFYLLRTSLLFLIFL